MGGPILRGGLGNPGRVSSGKDLMCHVLLMLTGHLSFPKQIQGRSGLGAKELGGEERGETATGM